MDTTSQAVDLAGFPGPYQEFYHASARFIPEDRIYCDPLRTLASARMRVCTG